MASTTTKDLCCAISVVEDTACPFSVFIVDSTVIVRCVWIYLFAHRIAVVSSWTQCMIVQKNPLQKPPSSGVISAHRCQIMSCTMMIKPKSPSLFHSRGNEKQPSSGGPQKAYKTGKVPDVTPGKTKWKKYSAASMNCINVSGAPSAPHCQKAMPATKVELPQDGPRPQLQVTSTTTSTRAKKGCYRVDDDGERCACYQN